MLLRKLENLGDSAADCTNIDRLLKMLSGCLIHGFDGEVLENCYILQHNRDGH